MANEDDIRELVIARLETAPEGLGLSFGGVGELSKLQQIEHVRAGDEIGKRIMEVQMNFLTSLKEGLINNEALYE